MPILLSSGASNLSKVRGLIAEKIQPLKDCLPLRPPDAVGRRDDDLAEIEIQKGTGRAARANEQPAAAVVGLDLFRQRIGDGDAQCL